ncbi:MAG: hypothetical protein ACR2MA_10205 [Egibacteraceae bacterium]
MSQERERFPIQPQDRRRTAKSFDDVATPPGDPAVHQSEENPPDKPQVPPHDRHARHEDEESESDKPA